MSNVVIAHFIRLIKNTLLTQALSSVNNSALPLKPTSPQRLSGDYYIQYDVPCMARQP